MKFKDMPEQKTQATLLEKGKYVDEWGDDSSSVVYYATFEFADGTRHRMDIGGVFPWKTYKSLRENKSGLLYYKRTFNSGYKGSSTFLRFLYDDTQLLPLYKPKVPLRSKSISEPENEFKLQLYLDGADQKRTDATVLEKAKTRWSSKMYITFLCANEVIKKFPVPIRDYAIIMRGDMGVLTFKKGRKDDVFIDFERNVSL